MVSQMKQNQIEEICHTRKKTSSVNICENVVNVE